MSQKKDRKLIKGLLLTGAVIIALISAMYGQVKANQAARNAMEALTQAERAEAETLRAEKLTELVQQRAAEAKMHKEEAMKVQQLLTECQNR